MQATAMGLEYTLADWLQVLLLLVGMPFISALGAAIGLIGRIRQGGFLPSIVAGLAGAAIASASLYLAIWTLRLEPTINPKVFLELYESSYQREIAILCMIATALIAFIYAIAWRFRTKPLPPTRISISLRTALLVQVLSLVCVGSWCGLRLLVIKSAHPILMMQRVWGARGWEFYNGTTLRLSGLGLSPRETAEALSSNYLADMARYPAVKSVGFAGCDLSEFDLLPLKSVSQLNGIEFTDCKIDKSVQRDLTQLSQLTWVSISELRTAQSTLTSLGKLPKLSSFTAANAAMERNDLRTFFATAPLGYVQLTNVEIYGEGGAIHRWPSSTTFISASGGNLTREDLKAIGNLKSLTHLHTKDIPLDDSVLEHYQGLNLLQNVSLTNKGISDRGYEIIATKMQPPRLAIYEGQLSLKTTELLGSMPQLQMLDLQGVILSDEDLARLAKAPLLSEMRLTSPGLTERGLMSFAAVPKLRQFQYPSFRGRRDFESKFAAERMRLGLPGAQCIPGNTIDAQGATTMLAP